MATVLVTGGAGFIGSHIVDLLCEHGHEVIVIDNLSSGLRAHLPTGVTFYEYDIRSREARTVLQQHTPDLIVHAAAQISVRESMDDPLFDAEVNVCGLLNLLQALRDRQATHIVFLSTGGAIYGEQEVFPASEEHPVQPTSFYGLAKYVGERYLDLWARSFGITCGVLRLANVYGPRQDPHGEAGVVAIFNKALLQREAPTIFGAGTQTRDFVYVHDVAEAVRVVCEEKISGVFNIGTGLETSVNELYRLICEVLSVDITPQSGPARTGEQMRSSIDAARAGKVLSWQPRVNLKEGLRSGRLLLKRPKLLLV